MPGVLFQKSDRGSIVWWKQNFRFKLFPSSSRALQVVFNETTAEGSPSAETGCFSTLKWKLSQKKLEPILFATRQAQGPEQTPPQILPPPLCFLSPRNSNMVCISEADLWFGKWDCWPIFIPNDEVQGYLLAMTSLLCPLAPSTFRSPAQHLPRGPLPWITWVVHPWSPSLTIRSHWAKRGKDKQKRM